MTERQSFKIHDPANAQAFLSKMPSWVRRRAKDGFAKGAVKRVRCEENGRHYIVEVEANWVYTVALFYSEDGWNGQCNCGQQFGCEHVCAAMTALLGGQDSVNAPEVVAKPEPTALEQRLAEAVKRKLRPDERSYLANLQQLYHQCRARGRVDNWQLSQHGFYNFGYGPEPLELWPSFPEDDYKFWLYLAYALEERKAPIPDFLLPVTDLRIIREAMAELKRRKEIARWQEYLRNSSSQRLPPKRSNSVDFRLVLGPESAHLEWKPTSEAASFKRLRHSTARRFAEEYASGMLEIVPEACPLWHPVSERCHHYGWHDQIVYTERESKRLLNPWLRLPGLQERIVTESGETLPRPAEPLRWQLLPAQTAEEDYKLHLARCDGGAPPQIWFTLPGRPTLYVSPHGIFQGPPPLEGTDMIKAASIPAPALETSEGLDLVTRLGLELPPRIQERAVQVLLKPKIHCELKPTYQGGGGSESLFVRVVAEADNSKARESFTANGWQGSNQGFAPKVKKNNKAIYFYDRSALELFPEVLEPLGLKWENYFQYWRVRLTKNLPNKFVEWLQSLPKNIEVQLDNELAALTREPTQATVKLDCTEAGVDWFDLKVVLDVEDTELTPQELKLLLDARGRFVRLGKKGWRRLQFNLSPEEDERLARLGLTATDFSSEPQRLHALQLGDKAASALLPEHQVEKIQRCISELKTRVTPSVPGSVRAELRPYQIEGFHFLAYLTANRFGGILADDMGLGKTLQTLTWLAWLRAQPESAKKPCLVVCPKSVMDTWRGEAERFTPDLRVQVWKGTDGSGLAAAAATDLLVMNYAQLRGLEETIGDVQWLAAILDEGQYIKNPESQTARAARSLKADYRLALSGTPIENRLLDLWSLMTFAMPGVLGNRAQFIKGFDQPGDPLARRRLSARVRPFLLRRTKTQVATDLPDRIEEELYCELEGEQKTLYQAEFKRAQQMLLNVHTREELNEFRFHFLTSLLRLRQICCHPALYSPDLKKSESAKLNAFIDLVEPLMQEGHKVLVFSQFVSMLDILRQVVQEKNWPHFYLAGDTENRGELVQEFQKAPGAGVFLISLKAGGFGLNLTAASYVVLFDPWWNPAVESQAIDRTHRIGQTSKVIAYRLLTKGSIEEKIRALQRTKAALMTDVLGEDSFSGSLTLEDLRFLFSDEAPAS